MSEVLNVYLSQIFFHWWFDIWVLLIHIALHAFRAKATLIYFFFLTHLAQGIAASRLNLTRIPLHHSAVFRRSLSPGYLLKITGGGPRLDGGCRVWQQSNALKHTNDSSGKCRQMWLSRANLWGAGASTGGLTPGESGEPWCTVGHQLMHLKGEVMILRGQKGKFI